MKKSQKSPVIQKILNILGEGGHVIYYIDKRKRGYSVKFAFIHPTQEQIKKIEKLPYVIWADEVESQFKDHYYTVGGFRVYLNDRPKNIVI